MRGLRLHLTPFAPDQSGAVSVLFELSGLVVIVDAGGCTGNICGFDEPRWHTMRSAVFSAGLRDMDAIMGRDDKLVAGITDAAEKIDASFCAIVGTPVPAVIGTDYRALVRMVERSCGLPTIALDTNGVELYDRGAEKATRALFRRFATKDYPKVPGRVGILGATPLDLSEVSAARLRALVPGSVTYGMDSVLSAIERASAAERNLVVSPAGLSAARLLEERFSIPFTAGDPRMVAVAEKIAAVHELASMRVLVVCQQVSAHTLREQLERHGAEVACATWFSQDPSLTRAGDMHLAEEDDLAELVASGSFDLVCCDRTCWPIFAGTYRGATFDLPEFPVSGRMWGDA